MLGAQERGSKSPHRFAPEGEILRVFQCILAKIVQEVVAGPQIGTNAAKDAAQKRRTGFAYRKLVTNQSPKDPCCGRRSGDRGPAGWSAGGVLGSGVR